eukprot:7992597-Lingulodinium_polyedra.AAC.1
MEPGLLVQGLQLLRFVEACPHLAESLVALLHPLQGAFDLVLVRAEQQGETSRKGQGALEDCLQPAPSEVDGESGHDGRNHVL